jgi:hypothetical protein
MPYLCAHLGCFSFDFKLQASSHGLYKLLVDVLQSVEVILTKFNVSSEPRFESFNLKSEDSELRMSSCYFSIIMLAMDAL